MQKIDVNHNEFYPISVVDVCTYCKALFASDEVCCHRCKKPATWSPWKYFLYRTFGYDEKEYQRLFHEYMSIRDIKDGVRQRNIDKMITMRQLTDSLESTSRLSRIRSGAEPLTRRLEVREVG